MMNARDYTIRQLSEGVTFEAVEKKLCESPYNLDGSTAAEMVRDSELLQAVVERSNNLINQAWGTMWQSIKAKAMLGSVPHCKLLIEFVQNGNKLNGGRLRIVFEDDEAADETSD